MKVTVKGFVYHQKYSWDDEVTFFSVAMKWAMLIAF